MIRTVMFAVLFAAALLLFMDVSVVIGGGRYIKSEDKVVESVSESGTQYDYIMVLGASVRKTVPSQMLQDRLDTALRLCEEGVSDQLFMSGDSSTLYYDEVGTMVSYAEEAGIWEDHILYDNYGLNTYTSLKHAKEEYGTGKILIVTQKYHLYRAVYIAKKLGFDVTGVASDESNYSGQASRLRREFGARIKDYLVVHAENWFGSEAAEAISKKIENFYYDNIQ